MKNKTGYKANRPSPHEIGWKYQQNQLDKLEKQVLKKRDQKNLEALNKFIKSIEEPSSSIYSIIDPDINTRNFNGS